MGMTIRTEVLQLKDQDQKSIQFLLSDKLTAAEAMELRSTIETQLSRDFTIYYINARNVEQADLSGINEIIHTHHLLSEKSRKLIFAYTADSAIDKWVETTGLDRFVETAVFPAG
jgi:ABC-type transporter Mla MlaB component